MSKQPDQMDRFRADLESLTRRISGPLETQVADAIRKGRRLRRRRRIGFGFVIIGVLLGITVPLSALYPLEHSGGPRRVVPGGREVAPQVPSGWQASTVRGVTLYTPTSWTVASDPVPTERNPAQVLAVGSYDFAAGGNCAPTEAINKLPNDGALFWLEEYANPDSTSGFPIKSDQVQLGPLLGPFECSGAKTHVISFQTGGRYFQAEAIFGPDASSALREEVMQSLSSISVAAIGNSQ
jgi:hypothetical protein